MTLAAPIRANLAGTGRPKDAHFRVCGPWMARYLYRTFCA